MSDKILFVDDDSNLLAAYQRRLHREFTVETASSGIDGLKRIQENGPYAVVVVDLHLPCIDGLDFLTAVAEKAPETIRIMLTGNTDRQAAITALNRCGVFLFLTKPCPAESLALSLRSALRQYGLVVAERRLLHNTLNGSVRLLTDILSHVNPAIFGHSQVVRDLARQAAGASGLGSEWRLELAAMLCHIGFVSLPRELVEKSQSGADLSANEAEVVNRVPEVSGELLTNIPRLQEVAQIVRYHQKNFDGTGYPMDALRGDAIPIESRVLKVLVDLAQLEARQVSRDRAWAHLRAAKGRYDPVVLDGLARIIGPG